MKLVYQIPDKLYYIQQFLDHPTYKQLHYDVFKSKLIELKPTENYWQESLKHGFKKYVKYSYLTNDYEPLRKLRLLLEHNVFHKIKIKNYKPLVHSMSDGSGINWHGDEGHQYGITYYVNRRWNRRFGGEFMFTSDTQSGFIPIIGNSLVIVKVPFEHKVAPVLKPLIPRKTIQIFVDKY